MSRDKIAVRRFEGVCIAPMMGFCLLILIYISGAAWAACPMCHEADNEELHWDFLHSLGPETDDKEPVFYTAKKAREENPAFQSMANASNNSTSTSTNSTAANEDQQTSSADTAVESANYSHGMLIPITEVGRSDLVVDVSDGATSYIDGAIGVPYYEFFDENGNMLSPAKMAEVIGQAGVTPQDSVIIYGECVPCGGGPSAATFADWVFNYLGHKNLRLLDGGVNEWSAAGYSTQANPSTRPPTQYTFDLQADLLATYDLVVNGDVQIVDARIEGFGMDNIPGAINIPYDQVLKDGRIMDVGSLKALFQEKGLDAGKPVVVYSKGGVMASMVWFALHEVGFDARLYPLEDYIKNQPSLNLELNRTLTRAEPNPTKPAPITITAVFQQAGTAVETSGSETSSSEENNSTEEAVLTTMGCVTCSPITLLTGGNLAQNKAQGVRLGSSGADNTGQFTAGAEIVNPQGALVIRIPLSQVAEDTYTGVWDASRVAPGTYSVSITASVDSIRKRFQDALQIAILPGEAAQTSRFVNVGST